MKIKRLLIGMLACSAMVACTNDDEILNNQEQENQKADKAYVMVRINNTEGISSRANDGGLEEGGTNEHAIKTVNFYFYSADGTFVTEGEVWNDPAGNVSEGKIEWKTNVAVVLNNLTQKGSPKYVLAVLNRPESLNLENKSIAEVQKEILEAAAGTEATGEGFLVNKVGDENYYIMTNSTYNGTSEVDGIAYFATAIDDNQFFKQPVEDDDYATNPVEIYVERLAAKVQLKIGTQAEGATKDFDGVTGYKLNELKVSDMVKAEGATEATMTVQKPTLYAKVLGWGLNATNKSTYLMKNVPAWTVTSDAAGLGFTWNDANNYRANWCYSPNYGQGTYPANYVTTGDNNLQDDKADAAKYDLNYTNWKSLGKAINGIDYCAENTNNESILMDNSQNFHATVTEILVKAEIVNEQGNKVELFRYDNVLYTRAAYLEKLFDKVRPQIGYQTGTREEDGKTIIEYDYISSEDVEENLINEGDGKVSVIFTLKTVAEGEESKVWGKITNGTFAEYQDDAEGTENGKTAIAKINADLKTAFEVLFVKERDTNNASYVLADHYNDGMMYYNIPIEHLRPQSDGSNENVTGNPYDADGAISVKEAEYGVVRNHWYQVTVNSIKNLGTAVHDANEDIIPDESNNVLYYIAARINVLSWKVVRQGVDL